MDIRDRLIEAAARVYAETGYRGATTRRIAQQAGVNEITLFRHFGSKDALIQEALRCRAGHDEASTLPENPRDPRRELLEWCRSRFDNLYASRSVIRKVMGEMEEHPEIVPFASKGATESACELVGYVSRLIDLGLAAPDTNPRAAATMLMGALFAEAMGRDIMTDVYASSVDEAIAEKVHFFTRALGVPEDDATPAATTPRQRGRVRG